MRSQDDLEFDPSSERPAPTSSPIVRAVLASTGIVAVMVGLAAFASWVKDDPEPTPPVVAELEPASAPVNPAPPAAPAAELLAAQAAVESLQQELAVQEAELAAVAEAAGVPADRLADTDLSKEVANLRSNLLAARRFRDHLKVELSEALAQVERAEAEVQTQRGETALARTEASQWRSNSTRNLWSAFAADTTLSVCDHGTRRGLERCKSEVSAWFTEARYDRFASCATAAQTPVLLGTDPGEPVPSNAEPITGEQIPRRTSWSVLFCDPRLPEAQRSASRDADPSDPAVASGSLANAVRIDER